MATDPEKPAANLAEFEKKIRPLLESSCVDCHGPDLQEGNIRIDTLDPNLLTGQDVDWWVEIFGVISNGEMPPSDGPELRDEDRSQVVDWLSRELQLASLVRRSDARHTSFRRMTKYEFNHALQDLLGLPWDFARDLPPEPHSEDGFQNSSEMLHMTVTQLETYRRLARQALERATVSGERPDSIYWGISMQDASGIDFGKQSGAIQKAREEFKEDPERLQQELAKLTERFRQTPGRAYYHDRNTGHKVVATWSYPGARYALKPSPLPETLRAEQPPEGDVVAILPAGNRQWLTIELGDQLPDQGVMRVRVRAARLNPDSAVVPSLQLHFGWQASNEGRAAMKVSNEDTPVFAGPESPQVIQWDIPLGDIYPRNSVKNRSPMGALPSPSEYIRLVNSTLKTGDDQEGAIQIEYVEVIAPFFEQWPPVSHRRIFPERNAELNEDLAARDILRNFMKRAWRREIQAVEVDRKLKLFRTVRADSDNFEQAMVEVLATVLASPHFLYLSRPAAKVADASDPVEQRLPAHELATRLSIFLWSSLPDDQLLALASSGELTDEQVLEKEVRRMLADPRAKRFSQQFVHQWLDLQILDFLNIRASFPGFDPLLKEAMAQEPVEFFHEVLQKNHSVLDFIHADYALANERLARHYGWGHVRGNEFQRVSLAADQRRGGLLTQAGLLAMNADGQDSHPLKRGIWLLESILNDPPPPPPPAVPEIDLADPEIAKMTLKERIENHRNHAACRSCHAKIDPWGIAFENYDALGRWRERIKDQPVDATSQLFNRTELAGMDGLKRYLLENRQDQFVRALVHKMATYALGRPLTFADRAEIEKITATVRQRGDGLATMVSSIVASSLFQSR